MKYRISLVVLTVLLIAAMVGCASTPAQPALPDFVLNPPQADDAIYGVGEARLSTVSNSRNAAMARARTDIAFQVNATVQASLTDYFQEAGVDGGNQVITFIESVSRQIADVELRGTRVERTEQGPDGTVYVLLVYPLSNFRQQAEEAFVRNEDAQFAEFKAQQALAALDAQLANNPPRAGNQ